MSGDRRRDRIRDGREGSAPERAGLGPGPRPNVLSNAVQPNTLSGLDEATPLRDAPSRRPAVARSTGPERRPRGGRARGSRIVQALVLIAIAVFVAISNAGNSPGGADETTVGATPGAPSEVVGPVTFATGHGPECELFDLGVAFDPEADVWWDAHLARTLPQDSRVVWLIRRDGTVFSEEGGPGDKPTGPWDQLCGGPIAAHAIGTYRLEVWDASKTSLLAAGGFEMRRASRTASPPPVTSPRGS